MRDPGGAPALHQQGTHKLADGNHRWMGSIAADQDGNVAIGYSVSNSRFPPYSLCRPPNGEIPGQMPQTERVLVNGTGSQTSISRWGDYSAMSVDPTDDCTFWYTQEYYITPGNNWQTRIGSFKFPSCGQPKGTITGKVVNSLTNAGIANAPVTITGGALEAAITVLTNATGNYTAQVLPATYTVTAGPLLPGYPTTNSVSGQVVTANNTTNVPDIPLTGVPHLIYNTVAINDTGGNGNGNGYPDPGETGVQLFVSLTNNGAATSTGISAVLSTTTPGVTVTQNTSAYPNIAAAGSAPNTTAYVISLSPTLVCGTVMQFNLAVTTTQGPYNFPFSITGASRSRRRASSSTTSRTASTAGPPAAPPTPGARPLRSPTARRTPGPIARPATTPTTSTRGCKARQLTCRGRPA